jgi:hypothetical protein
MDIVGHEAVPPNLDLVGTARLRHQRQVTLVIFIAKERLLSAVFPLRDVVRQAGRNTTCQPSHTRKLPDRRAAVDDSVWCFRNSVPGTPAYGSVGALGA